MVPVQHHPLAAAADESDIADQHIQDVQEPPNNNNNNKTGKDDLHSHHHMSDEPQAGCSRSVKDERDHQHEILAHPGWTADQEVSDETMLQRPGLPRPDTPIPPDVQQPQEEQIEIDQDLQARVQVQEALRQRSEAQANERRDDAVPNHLPQQHPGPQEQEQQHEYPAIQVRSHIFHRLRSGIHGLGGRQRSALLTKACTVMAQMITFCVVLGLTRKVDCDNDLRIYLVLYTIRIALSLPVHVYNRLLPPRLRSHETYDLAAVRRREANRPLGNAQLDKKVKVIGTFLTAFAAALFICGNWIFYTDSGCQDISPLLFWSCFAALCFGYMYLAEIAILGLLVAFFLPLVLMGATTFGLGHKKHEIRPLDKKEIDKLPLVLYIPDESETGEPAQQAQNEAGTELRPVETRSSMASKKSGKTSSGLLTGKWKRTARLFAKVKKPSALSSLTNSKASGSADNYVAGPYPFRALPENLAACPICLSDFEPPPLQSEAPRNRRGIAWEPLRALPCGHVLHKDCLDPWLSGQSGRCPVCQAPVKKQAKDQQTRPNAGTDGGAAEDLPPEHTV